MTTLKKTKKLILISIIIFLTSIVVLGFKYQNTLVATYYRTAQKVELWRAGVRDAFIQHGTSKFHILESGVCDLKSHKGCQCTAWIHGLGDSAMTWRRVFTEPESQQVLYKDHYWLAIDLLGSGESSIPDSSESYRVSAQATQLIDVLRSIRICKTWTLVGNSFGGWIVAQMAYQSLQQNDGVISRLLLLAPAGIQQNQTTEAVSLLSNPTIESLKEFQQKAYDHPRQYADSFWEEAVKRAKLSHSKEIVLAQKDEDFLDRKLPTLTLPTLLLRGKSDRIISRDIHEMMGQLIPGVIFREVDRCGHLPQKECVDSVLRSLNDLQKLGMM